MAAVIPYVIVKAGAVADNTKLLQVIDGSITKVTADDLKGVTKLRGYAFAACKLYDGVELPDTITAIANQAFMYSSLPSIEIGDAVTTIGSSVFQGCAKLAEVTIGKNVVEIGNATFSGCTALKKITCYANTPVILGTNVLLNVPYNCEIFVPAAAVNAYKAADGWSSRANYIKPIPVETITITIKTTETIFPNGIYATHQAPKGMTMLELVNSSYNPKNPVDEPFYTCASANATLYGDYGSAALYTDSSFSKVATGALVLSDDTELWIKW